MICKGSNFRYVYDQQQLQRTPTFFSLNLSILNIFWGYNCYEYSGQTRQLELSRFIHQKTERKDFLSTWIRLSLL